MNSVEFNYTSDCGRPKRLPDLSHHKFKVLGIKTKESRIYPGGRMVEVYTCSGYSFAPRLGDYVFLTATNLIDPRYVIDLRYKIVSIFRNEDLLPKFFCEIEFDSLADLPAGTSAMIGRDPLCVKKSILGKLRSFF